MTAILKVDTIQDTAGNNIINESSDTITIGASGDTIALAGTTVTGITQGITVADSWRLTANITNTDADITANLERDDTAGVGFIGSAMTQSSGVFTFPSTGIYQITFFTSWSVSNENESYAKILTTINNSSYTTRGQVYASTTGGDHIKSASTYCFFDVTDTSNCKIKFATASMNSSCTLRGSSTINDTSMVFLRLGNT